jgi:hypothetical protein
VLFDDGDDLSTGLLDAQTPQSGHGFPRGAMDHLNPGELRLEPRHVRVVSRRGDNDFGPKTGYLILDRSQAIVDEGWPNQGRNHDG